MTLRTTQVHQRLLHELRAGSRRPGAAISVKDAAERYAVSPTPVLAIEAAFEIVFLRSTNAVTIWMAHRLSNILASYRMVEPEIIPSWHADLDQLAHCWVERAGKVLDDLDRVLAYTPIAVGCGPAWKKNPGSGVIGIEKGPLIPVV